LIALQFPLQLENKIADLTKKYENGEIQFEIFNEQLIALQVEEVNERIKNIGIMENKRLNDKLVKELGTFFKSLTKMKKMNKFDPHGVEDNIDTIFRKYGETIEKEEDEEIFVSNPITSDISTVINLPVPLEYQKQLENFEKITGSLGIEDAFAYVTLRLDILTANLNKYLRHDIMYVTFNQELLLEFCAIKTAIDYIWRKSDVIIDEDIQNFLNKHDIKEGNIPIIREIISEKLSKLSTKFKNVQESVFEKQDSMEVLKIFKQLKDIFIRDESMKFRRRFTDKEIIDDFKNKSLEFIIHKYGQYVKSDYFNWTTKEDEIVDESKFIKRSEIAHVKKDFLNLRDIEIKEYEQKAEFIRIISTLPRKILEHCAESFIQEGKISEPYKDLTLGEQYINELYTNSVGLWGFNNENIVNYNKEIEKMTDELNINKNILELKWTLGERGASKIQIGNIVHIDRTYERIKKLEEKIKNDTASEKEIMALNSYGKYMRAPQYEGIVVDIKDDTIGVVLNNTKKTNVRYFSKLSVIPQKGTKNLIPLYRVIESVDLKENSLLPIVKWIRVVLRKDIVDFSKDNLIKLYDEALEKYKALQGAEKKIVNERVLLNLPLKYLNVFTPEGIPNNSLLFVYPPLRPGEIKDYVSIKDVFGDYDNDQEYEEYVKKLNQYIDNLTPETSPFIKIGVSIPNSLIDQVDKNVYSSLYEAVKNTPINGYFRLTPSLNGFQTLVLDFLTTEEKKQLQYYLMSEEQIKDFYKIFYEDREIKDKTKKIYKSLVVNPRISQIKKLGNIIEPTDYINAVKRIDKKLNITKVVGEKVILQDRKDPVTKKIIEDILLQTAENEYKERQSDVIVEKNFDIVAESIKFTLSHNSTFQLLALENRIKNTLIINTDPKYRIRIVQLSGTIYKGWTGWTGWTINPLKNELKGEYKRTYPMVITDFTKYLQLYRSNQIVKYNAYKQLDILSHEKYLSSALILNRIKYISQYLKDIGEENEEPIIELISSEDSYQIIRNTQRMLVLNALNSKSPETSNIDLATAIEMEVYNIFSDLRKSIIKTKKKWEPTHSRWTQIVFSGFMGPINQPYGSYLYRINVAIINIENTNPIDWNIDNIVYRELTEDEQNSKELHKWVPSTPALNAMKNKYPQEFNTLIYNASIMDISIFNSFEAVTGVKYGELTKRYALIELVKLRSWQSLQEKEGNVDNLQKFKNNLRPPNDIRLIDRLDCIKEFSIFLKECGQSNSIYAENIEINK